MVSNQLKLIPWLLAGVLACALNKPLKLPLALKRSDSCPIGVLLSVCSHAANREEADNAIAIICRDRESAAMNGDLIAMRHEA